MSDGKGEGGGRESVRVLCACELCVHACFGVSGNVQFAVACDLLLDLMI